MMPIHPLAPSADRMVRFEHVQTEKDLLEYVLTPVDAAIFEIYSPSSQEPLQFYDIQTAFNSYTLGAPDETPEEVMATLIAIWLRFKYKERGSLGFPLFADTDLLKQVKHPATSFFGQIILQERELYVTADRLGVLEQAILMTINPVYNRGKESYTQRENEFRMRVLLREKLKEIYGENLLKYVPLLANVLFVRELKHPDFPELGKMLLEERTTLRKESEKKNSCCIVS